MWQESTRWVSTSLTVSVAPKKSASGLGTDFLSQKTLQHFCLHFRERLPPIQELELLKRPSRRKENRKLLELLLRMSHGGGVSSVGNIKWDSAFWIFWTFCLFSEYPLLAERGYSHVNQLHIPHGSMQLSLCHAAGTGEHLKVKVLLEMLTVYLNLPHKAWSLR